MPNTETTIPTARRPLRLWPGVAAGVLTVVLFFIAPRVTPANGILGMMGGLAAAVIVLLWWLLFSRAAWVERIGVLVTAIVAIFAIRPLLDPSIATGMMNRMYFVYVLPVLAPAIVLWAATTRRWPDRARRISMVVTVVLACALWTLFRTDGIKGEVGSEIRWRWTPTAEQRLLAQGREEELKPVPPLPAETPAAAAEKPGETAPTTPAAKSSAVPAPASDKPAEGERAVPADPIVGRAEWPGFRGEERNGTVRGLQIETDWSRTPPVEIWRRPIGPGWSSFAVQGDLIYTQEQRGEHELVTAYRLSSGEPVWRHRDPVRFWESNGGAGPRGTPTLHNGRVYTFGATGIVNALDARTGARVWSRDASKDSGREVPIWGFTSSPLIVDDSVIVAASGRLVAYDIRTGAPRWTRATRGGGYSSPHFATIDGVPQVLLLSGGGATGVAPSDGTVLWDHAWVDGVGFVQPAFVPNGDIIIASGDAMGGQGLRRIAVSRGPSGWTVQERWTTRGLKPYFNDFVVHEGHAYGFDGSILACIDLETGERKWKGGRYGQGQLVLLPEQDTLLLISEEGELALVSATPDGYREMAKFKAIEGKTWNHPALVRDTILVRNGEEMAAFRLPTPVR